MTRFRHAIFVWMAVALMPWAVAFDPVTDESGIYTIAWERGVIPMQVNLNNTQILSDGTTPRGSLEEAMTAWNAELGNVQFTWSFGVEGSYELGNDVNEIVMDSTIEGFSFGANTLAVAISYNDGNYRAESDVIFNSAWEWDGYRGALRDNEDIRRVATHELGHVLGLLHPDQADPPQNVQALMNSIVSDLDGLQQDDIEGGQFLYGDKNAVPGNDNFSAASEMVLDGDGRATAYGTNVQSTTEAGEPVLDPDYPGGHSVWWKWTAPRTDYAIVTTLSSRFDTVVGVFTGSSVGDLQVLGTNDDVVPTVIRTSTVGFVAHEGVTYYMMVDGWDGYEGAIQINLTAPAPMPPPEVSVAASRVRGVIGQPVNLAAIADVLIGEPVYQWRKDGRLIPGATSASLTVASFTNADAGAYTVEVSANGGPIGYATSFVLPDYQQTEVVGLTSRNYGGPDLTIPDDLGVVLAVAAEGSFSLALKSDGTVAGWTAGLTYNFAEAAAAVPEGLSDVVAIAAGLSHGMALRANGTVEVWGNNDKGQLNMPTGLKNVVAIAAGDWRSFALRADGSVVEWGQDYRESNAKKPEVLPRAVGLRAGGDRAGILKEDGTIAVWGGSGYTPLLHSIVDFDVRSGVSLNAFGEVDHWGKSLTGIEDMADDVVRVFGGHSDQGFLTAAGSFQIWGQDFGISYRSTEPIDNVVNASIGQAHALVLRDLSTATVPTFMQVPSAQTVAESQRLELKVKVGGRGTQSYVWQRDGEIVQNDERLSGAGTPVLRIDPVRSTDAGDYRLVVTSGAGTQTSTVIPVTVNSAPRFTTRPLTTLVTEGDRVVLTGVAEGTGTIHYQWSHEGIPIEGAVGAVLEFDAVTLPDRGRYSVTAYDDFGKTSSYFFLQVAARAATVLNWEESSQRVFSQLPGGIASVVKYKPSAVLDRTGRVTVWGSWENTAGLSEMTDVVDISAWSVSGPLLVLSAEGKISVFGKFASSNMPPADLTEVIAIQAGDRVHAALTADGTVVRWGSNESLPSLRPNRNIVSFGSSHSVLREDGTMSGSNGGNFIPVLDDVVSIVGGTPSLVLQRNGQVLTSQDFSRSLPPELNNVAQLARDIAINKDGLVVSWAGGLFRSAPAEIVGAIEVGSRSSLNNWAILPAVAPALVQSPAAAEVLEEESVELSVAVSGSLPLSFIWTRDGAPLVESVRFQGTTGPTLHIDPVRREDGGMYSVKIFNVAGEVTTQPVRLSVIPVPQPATLISQFGILGSAVEFDAETGEPSDSYAWYHNGEQIQGATSAKLELPLVTRAEEGRYKVRITNLSGETTTRYFRFDTAGEGAVPVVWGNNSSGQKEVPADLSGVVQIAFGLDHVLALTADGNVFAWGSNSVGQTNVPIDLKPVKRIAAGRNFCVVLQDDGQLVAWGHNDVGQTNVPAYTGKAVDVVATANYAVALLDTGELLSWIGELRIPDDFGPAVGIAINDQSIFAQLDDGTVWLVSRNWGPRNIPELNGVVELDAARTAQLGRLPNGNLVESSVSSASSTTYPASGGTIDLAQIAASEYHVVVSKTDGNVLAWGADDFGQSSVPAEALGAYAVAAGQSSSAALVPRTGLRITALSPQARLSAGEPYALRVEVAGEVGVLQYQWFLDGGPLADVAGYSGSNEATLNISRADGLHTGNYTVEVRDDVKVVRSMPRRIEVETNGVGPVFTLRPLTKFVTQGEAVTFTAEAPGAIRYLWRRDSQLLAGGYDGQLVISSPKFDDRGFYTVTAVSESGATSSSVFHVKVAAASSQLLAESSQNETTYTDITGLGRVLEVVPAQGGVAILHGAGEVAVKGTMAENLKAELGELRGVVKFNSIFALREDGSIFAASGSSAARDLVAGLPNDVVDIDGTGGGVWLLHADGTVSFVDTSGGSPSVRLERFSSNVVQVTSTGVVKSDGRLAFINVSAREESYWYSNPGLIRKIADPAGIVLLRDGTLWPWTSTGQYKMPELLLGESFRDGGPGYLIRHDRTGLTFDRGKVVAGALDNQRDVWSALVGYYSSYGIVSAGGPSAEINPALPEGVALGGKVSMGVTAGGVGELRYEWRRDGKVLESRPGLHGLNTAELEIDAVALSDFGHYTVDVVDDSGSIEVELGELEPNVPLVVHPPWDQLLETGASAAMRVVARGPGSLTYQWYLGNSGDTSFPLSGENTDTLTVVASLKSARYWARVSGSSGHADSASAQVTVMSPMAVGLTAGAPRTLGSSNGTIFYERAGEFAVSIMGMDWQKVGDFWTSGRSAFFVHVGDVFMRSDLSGYRVERSLDLETWEQIAGVSFGYMRTMSHDGVAYLVAGQQIRRSEDGLTWTTVSQAQLNRLVRGNGRWVGFGGEELVRYSDDGEVWRSARFPSDGNVVDAGYGHGRFVAVVADSPGTRLFSSVDGLDWDEISLPDALARRTDAQLVVGETQFVLKGVAATLASDDGIHWAEGVALPSNLFRMIYTGDRYAAAKTDGTLLVSNVPPPINPVSIMASNRIEAGTSITLSGPNLPTGSRIQWYEGLVGDISSPVVGGHQASVEVLPAASTSYWARVTDGFSVVDSNPMEVEVVFLSPVIGLGPQGATIRDGESYTFSVSVTGTAPLMYQWFHDGNPIAGASEMQLAIEVATSVDAGRYRVEISNGVGRVVSREVVLSVLPGDLMATAQHQVDSGRYRPGGEMTIRGTLDFDESVTAASWSVLMPTGWSLQVLADDNPEALSQPEIGEQDLLEWSWSTVGESPLAFRFTLSVPITQRGVAEITSLVGVTVAGAEVQLLANPDPLEITPAPHSADMDGDQQISLSELLRVIELYNTRFGSSRSGRYRLAESSADGFEPDGRDLSVGSLVTRFHSADYSQDGRLSLSELLRVIELYNTRSGSRRTGAYVLKSDSVDGFAPGTDQ